MFKNSTLTFFYAETSVHAGSGEPFEAIDRAIQRERHTKWPVVWSSGVKGAARDWFTRRPETTDAEVVALFGPETDRAHEHGGSVSFTDARTLLLPVRSVRGTFAWTTCPAVLGRLTRDLATAKQSPPPPIPVPAEDRALATAEGKDTLGLDGDVLEELAYPLDADDELSEGDARVRPWAEWLRDHALPQSDEYQFFRERLLSHLLVLTDEAFTDFALYATELQARVKLGDGKSTDPEKGGNLFYQENLPSDTVLYSGLHVADDLSGTWPHGGRASDLLAHVLDALHGKRMQVGGDEFVGKGVCKVHFLDAPS